MHLTLKLDTASPVAPTLNQQLRQLEEFIEIYNFERPHEALDDKTPGEVYTKSPRIWSGKLKSPEYDSEYMVRKVGSNGEISVKDKWIYIGRTLMGEPVGLKETDSDIEVYYGPVLLGYLINNKVIGFKDGKKAKR